MKKSYNILISKTDFQKNLDINSLISTEKENIKQLETAILDLEDKLTRDISQDEKELKKL